MISTALQPLSLAAQFEQETSTDLNKSIGIQSALVKKIQDANTAISKEDYATAFPLLQEILILETDLLLQPEDFPTQANINPLSLKNIATDLLAQLPAAGKRLYELQYGSSADTLWNEIQNSESQIQHLPKLKELSQKYFHTQSGQLGTFQLANYFFDRSQFQSAILLYNRLLENTSNNELRSDVIFRLIWANARLGKTNHNKALLTQLKSIAGQKRFTFKDQTILVADLSTDFFRSNAVNPHDSPPLGLSSWTHTRGTASRNSTAANAHPLGELSWKINLFQEAFESIPQLLPPLNQLVERILHAAQRDEQVLLPAIRPLVTQDKIITRTMAGIQAVELDTGKLIWKHVQHDANFETKLSKDLNYVLSNQANGLSSLESVTRAKLWTNSRNGALSTNEKLVFALDHVYPNPNASKVRMFRGNRRIERFNRLVALDANSGKAVWELGGERLDQVLPLAGYYFLGPPLCAHDQLFSIALNGTELILISLEPHSGKVLREQTLQTLSPLQAQKTLLSSYELAPAAIENLIICPTVTGQLMAFNLLDDRWQWTSPDKATRQHHFQLNQADPFVDTMVFIDSSIPNTLGEQLVPVTGNGFVFLAPSESPVISCIEATSGKMIWNHKKKDFISLIGLTDDFLLVLNKHSIEAVPLNDQPEKNVTAWTTPLNSLPSGQPLLSSTHLHIPTAEGHILSLDSQTGEFLSQYTLPNNHSAGQLIASRGRLICQSEEYLLAFATIETSIDQLQLAIKSETPSSESLQNQAHYLLLQKQTDQALTLLRKINATKPIPSATHLLTTILIERIHRNPRNSNAEIEELISLVQSTEDSFSTIKLIANIYAGQENYSKAIQTIISFLKTGDLSVQALQKENAVMLRFSDWIQPQISGWFAHLTSEEQLQLKIDGEELLNKFETNQKWEQIKFLESVFRDIPFAPSFQRSLLKQTQHELKSIREQAPSLQQTQALSKLEQQAEFRLRQLTQQTDQTKSVQSMIELLSLLIDQERFQEATSWLTRLQTDFPEVKYADQATALDYATQQLITLRSWEKEQVSQWDADQFEVQHYARTRRIMRSQRIELPLIVDQPSELATYRYFYNLQTRQFQIETSTGELKWSIPLANSSSVRQSSIFLSNRVLLLNHGLNLYVWNVSRTDSNPILLWKQSLKSPTKSTPSTNLRYRNPSFSPSFPSIGPIIEDRVFYRIDETLYAADLFTGTLCWKRRGIPDDASLFGNSKTLGVLGNNSRQPREILALNPVNGKLLKTLPIHNFQIPQVFSKENCVSLFINNNRQALKSQNILTGEITWEHPLPANVVWNVISDQGKDLCAILSPTGIFEILDMATGRAICQTTVPEISNLNKIRLISTQERFLILVEGPMRRDRKATFRPPHVLTYNEQQTPFLVNEALFSINKETLQLEWSQKVDKPVYYIAQPHNLPFLLFYLQQQERTVARGHSSQLTVQVLETRSGKSLYQDNVVSPYNTVNIEITPEKKQVEYHFNNFTLRVKPVTTEKKVKKTVPEGKEAPTEEP